MAFKAVGFLVSTFALSLLAGTVESTAASVRCTLEDAALHPGQMGTVCTPIIDDPKVAADEKAAAYRLRGYWHATSSRSGAAIADFDAGLRLVPNHDQLHRLRGWIAYAQQDLATALHHLKVSLSINPDNPDTYYLLALAVHDMNDFDAALAALDKGLKLKPAHYTMRYMRAGLLMNLDRYPDALEDTAVLVKSARTSYAAKDVAQIRGRTIDLWSAAMVRHAIVLGRLGQHEEGEKIANDVVAKNRNAVTLFARAQYFYSMPTGPGLPARLDHAIADARDAVRLDPTYAYAQWSLGLYLHYAKKPAEALTEMESGIRSADIRIQGELGEMLWGRARVLRSLDRKQEATTAAIEAFTMAHATPGGGSRRILGRLKRHGYWQADDTPTQGDKRIISAVTACMQDRACW